MSAVFTPQPGAPALRPLLSNALSGRPLLVGGAGACDTRRFIAQARSAAAVLPESGWVVNLCEDRHHFLVGLCAAMLRGQTTLLPPSRAPAVIAEVLARHPGSYCLVDADHRPAPPRAHRLRIDPDAVGDGLVPEIPDSQCVVLGFTSGSTGQPRGHAKTWGAFAGSNAGNRALVEALLAEAGHAGGRPSIVATVPSQHMYGMETTVLLPLLGDCHVHAGRPFFPVDVQAALASVPAPRILVTTPVHLRALVASGLAFPPVAGLVSATAPLPEDLARAAEAAFQAPLQELFGSTETCVIAHRRTAREAAWTLQPGVELSPQPDGSLVRAPWLPEPVLLQDLVERLDGDRFVLRGRQADQLEIAGKRASLADLTRRVLAIDGVQDAIVFQTGEAGAAGVGRVAALVVAPGLDEAAVLEALRECIDPVFLPRPLRLVARLPRNETGKLPRAALLRALDAGD